MNQMIKAKVKSEKKHICQECGSSFYRPYRLLQHLLLHRNIRAYTCGEMNCNKAYSSKSHLDRHIHSVHIKPNFEVINRCPECMKIFSNRQNLKRHIKAKHFRKEKFICDVCHADFKKKHLLSAHMYQHTLVKSFSCEFCNKELVTLNEKKKHLKIHKTYNCELCDMAFNQWSKYQKHKQTEHNNKDYICDDCGRHFKQRQHIVRHVKIHMSQPVFKCWYKDCNRLYSRNSNLRQHIRIKHMDLTHPCGICGLKLSSKPKLNAHFLLIHCKEEIVCKQPTKIEGRKDRKDKGTAKTSIALKLAGLHRSPVQKHNMQFENNPKESQKEVKPNITMPSEEVIIDIEQPGTVETQVFEREKLLEKKQVFEIKTEAVCSTIILSVDQIKNEAENIADVTSENEISIPRASPINLSIKDDQNDIHHVVESMSS